MKTKLLLSSSQQGLVHPQTRPLAPRCSPLLPRQPRGGSSGVRHLPTIPPIALKAAAGQPSSGDFNQGGAPGSEASQPQQPAQPAQQQQEQEKPGPVQRIKNWFASGKIEKDKILSLGMGGFASYGVISNLNYGTALTISWLGFVKATGTSPLWPGQWKPFLAFYAGMWTVQNFVRPLRFALAVALAPFFENVIRKLSEKTGNRGLAFGLLMVVIAVVTSSCLFGTLFLLGGFPPAPQA